MDGESATGSDVEHRPGYVTQDSERVFTPLLIWGIHSEDVPKEWEHVRPLLGKVLERVDTGDTEASLLAQILTGDMQLWNVQSWRAMVITQISVCRTHRKLMVCYMAGEGLEEWFDQCMDVLEAFAMEHGCQYVEEYGRPGWERVGKKRGYEKVYTVMRKPLWA